MGSYVCFILGVFLKSCSEVFHKIHDKKQFFLSLFSTICSFIKKETCKFCFAYGYLTNYFSLLRPEKFHNNKMITAFKADTNTDAYAGAKAEIQFQCFQMAVPPNLFQINQDSHLFICLIVLFINKIQDTNLKSKNRLLRYFSTYLYLRD